MAGSCSAGAVITAARRHAAVLPALAVLEPSLLLHADSCSTGAVNFLLNDCRQLFSRLSHFRSLPGAVLPALTVLKVLNVDELVNVEKIHLAAHLARTVHQSHGVGRLLAVFPLRCLNFPGRFFKLEPCWQLGGGGGGRGSVHHNL